MMTSMKLLKVIDIGLDGEISFGARKWFLDLCDALELLTGTDAIDAEHEREYLHMASWMGTHPEDTAINLCLRRQARA